MNNQEKDVYILQLIKYFETKMNYSEVRITDVDSRKVDMNLWLFNPQNNDYPIIKICKSVITFDPKEKEKNDLIAQTIKSTFKVTGKRLEIYIDEDIKENEEDSCYQITINPDRKIPSELLNVFPELDKACHASKNPRMERKKIIEYINDYRMDSVLKRNREDKIKAPIITFGVIAICVIVYLISLFLLKYTSDQIAISILVGSYYKAFIVGMNEYFRFLSVGFVHIEILHLVMNLIAMFYIGRICEKIYGHGRFLVILLASIIMGSVFVFIAGGNTVTVGLSGGIYGLMAATFVYYFESNIYRQPAIRNAMISTALINLMLNFMPGISWLSHLGGFACGLLLAVIFSQSDNWEILRKNCIVSLIILLAVNGYLMSRSLKLDSVYFGTDIAVSQLADEVGLHDYGNKIYSSMVNYYQREGYDNE